MGAGLIHRHCHKCVGSYASCGSDAVDGIGAIGGTLIGLTVLTKSR
jgi:hypothetical protein